MRVLLVAGPDTFYCERSSSTDDLELEFSQLVVKLGYKPGASTAVAIMRRLDRLLAKVADANRGYLMRTSRHKHYEYDINSTINKDTWNDGRSYSAAGQAKSRHVVERRAERAAAGKRMAVRDFHKQ
jgi:hypothetical protein